MRLRLIAAFALFAACSTDDGATGRNDPENDTKVDNSNQNEPSSEDAGGLKIDAAPARGSDGAVADGAVADDAAAADDAGPAEDAATAEDSSVSEEDSGSAVEDAGQDAGIKRCGTRGGITCKANEFCDFGGDPLCGATDKGGLCKPIEKGCTKEYAPVCGCDKRTYANACTANAAGVSVLRDGLCSPEECEKLGGQILYSYGAGTPKCEPGQESWALSGGIEPVVCCFPKKVTPVDPGICGGIAGFPCAKGQFCNYEKGQGCSGIADAAGQCEAMPQVCPAVYIPVCGCDGKTYSSACNAHGAGQAVKKEGACL